MIRVGQTEQALGEIEREYIRHGHESMIGPLQRFLEGEMKNIVRERRILENKRLDLDACKNKVRKARGMQLQPAVRNPNPVCILPTETIMYRIEWWLVRTSVTSKKWPKLPKNDFTRKT